MRYTKSTQLNSFTYCDVSLKIQLNISHLFYTQLNDQAILFNISHLFAHSLNVYIYPLIRPFQVLPLWARLDLGVMAMKEYSAFPKAQALLEPHHQIVQYHIEDARWQGGSYPSAEMQTVYSAAPANWACGNKDKTVNHISESCKLTQKELKAIFGTHFG